MVWFWPKTLGNQRWLRIWIITLGFLCLLASKRRGLLSISLIASSIGLIFGLSVCFLMVVKRFSLNLFYNHYLLSYVCFSCS
ncbi:hypothetical protein EPI10_020159 [Gossypium australe]|uniref:Uncharacterized protein n=1 Tax=Gossypium australe TaxID=47621 RepID=A0A5B6WEI9_9ROSI|nr:hypothetical protein EPI10_020159 [Gossypium australe]